MAFLEIFLFCLVNCHIVHGFSSGATQRACNLNISPDPASHGAPAQLPSQSPSPYQIVLPESYVPGQFVIVILNKAQAGIPNFRGFMCQIRDQNDNVVGRWALEHPTAPPTVQQRNCVTAPGSRPGPYLTHTNQQAGGYNSITTYWIVEDNPNPGPVTVRCAFVQTRPVYWTNVLSQPMRQEAAPVAPTTMALPTTMAPTVPTTMAPTTMAPTVPTTMAPTTMPPTTRNLPTNPPPVVIPNQVMNCYECFSGWTVCGKEGITDPKMVGTASMARTRRCLTRLDKSGEVARSSADGFPALTEMNLPPNACVPGDVTIYGDSWTMFCTCSTPNCNTMGIQDMIDQFGVMNRDEYMATYGRYVNYSK